MNPSRPVPGFHLRRVLRDWLLTGLSGALVAQCYAQSDIMGPTSRSPLGGDGFSPPSYVPIRPVVICFPTTPPPLDRPISHLAPPAPPRLTPPAELAAYQNEPFYAPLSTWLIERTLSAKMRDRVETLRTAKANALSDLRTTLEQTRDTDPATRRTELESFARQQTPSLASLEAEAEKIRVDLAVSKYDWREIREWALGESSRRADSPVEIAATMRAYAFYQTGLVPAQRRLLREISLELAMAGEDAAAAQAAQPFMFFSPEPARVLLPDDLPADLAAKVAVYQTKKSALKKELYDTVYKSDNAAFSLLRNNALKSLAEKQAPQLAELEPLAEDIRRGLAGLPSPTKRPSAASPLPPVITARIDAVVAASSALQKEAMQKVDAVRADIANEPIALSYSFETSGLKFSVSPRLGPFGVSNTNKTLLEQITTRVREVENTMTEIAGDFGRRLADLVNETESIRAAAAVALGQTNQRVVDAALSSARQNSLLKETEDAYHEYRVAVFEPGLSPEQRRLLFGGAIEKLDLPLLRGEFQPVRRAAGW